MENAQDFNANKNDRLQGSGDSDDADISSSDSDDDSDSSNSYESGDEGWEPPSSAMNKQIDESLRLQLLGIDLLVPPESRLTIIIYDLPMVNFTKEDLFLLFIPFGPIDVVEALWEDKPNDPEFNFGYVTYFFPEAARNAVSRMNNKMVGENQIQVWQLFDFE